MKYPTNKQILARKRNWMLWQIKGMESVYGNIKFKLGPYLSSASNCFDFESLKNDVKEWYDKESKLLR